MRKETWKKKLGPEYLLAYWKEAKLNVEKKKVRNSQIRMNKLLITGKH